MEISSRDFRLELGDDRLTQLIQKHMLSCALARANREWVCFAAPGGGSDEPLVSEFVRTDLGSVIT